MNLNRDFPEIVEILGKRGLRQVLTGKNHRHGRDDKQAVTQFLMCLTLKMSL